MKEMTMTTMTSEPAPNRRRKTLRYAFGRILLAELRAVGLSIARLARATGGAVSPAMLASCVRGESTLKPAQFRAVEAQLAAERCRQLLRDDWRRAAAGLESADPQSLRDAWEAANEDRGTFGGAQRSVGSGGKFCGRCFGLSWQRPMKGVCKTCKEPYAAEVIERQEVTPQCALAGFQITGWDEEE
jgi:hypothetical protein